MPAAEPEHAPAQAEHACLRFDSPVSLDDVTEAARILLRREQDNLHVNWRDERWFDDDELTVRVREDRRMWTGTRWVAEQMFDENWAQEVVMAALAPECAPAVALGPDGAVAPLFVISSLDQLGIPARTAFEEDYWVGFGLLDRPEWFDPIRLGGIAVSEVPYLRDVFGTTRFDLLLRLGWDCDALLAAAANPGALDLRSLRTMVALRPPSLLD